ncbi:hypothetical protein MXD62_15695 [Frankia sp. Mgl5]|uniref:hypothetical protein n=1 Tax=Frankia sp. Mgl5 TaxID=2933793 RepID=UPI00200D598B|nr:hypothetical protein [Frankia sp. Mgl5]MCK9928598.1 hypothetical protein [Frankia sp. Mgl5]
MARTCIIVATRTVVVVAAVVGLTMVLGGCEGGQRQEAVSASVGVDVAASSTPVATASPTPVVVASSTPVATASPSPIAAIADAVKRDPAIASDAAVEKITISSIDSTWASAATSSPSAGGARAVLHETGGTWKVVSFGSSEVGCDDGVPAAVMTEFGLECPS